MRRDYENPLPLDQEGSRFRTMWQRIQQHAGPDAPLAWIAWSLRDNAMPGEAYEYGHRAAFNYIADYDRLIGRLELPQLIINPLDDCYQVTRRVEGRIRNGELIERRDWVGSSFPDYRADQVASLIHDWLCDG